MPCLAGLLFLLVLLPFFFPFFLGGGCTIRLRRRACSPRGMAILRTRSQGGTPFFSLSPRQESFASEYRFACDTFVPLVCETF